MKELLPIGSIVMLDGAIKRLTICGRIKGEAELSVTYDYSVCYFLEGITNPDQIFLFTNDAINKVYSVRLQYLEELEDKLTLMNN